MGKLEYLALAYAAIWTGIFIYLLNIAKNLTYIKKQVKLLKDEIAK
jgi:CcmD family protein